MRYRPGSRRSSAATPLSDDVIGANAAARAPSSSPLTVTVAPGTTAPDASTTVTIRRPSSPLCAKDVIGARIKPSTTTENDRRSISRACHGLNDGAIKTVRELNEAQGTE